MPDRLRPRGRDRLRALALAALAALAIAACGGEDGGGEPATIDEPAAAPQDASPGDLADQGSDRQLIRAAIEAALASADPERACDLDVTERFVNAAYGDHDGCVEAQRAGGHAESVAVSAVKVDGDRATATAVPAGGPSGGERLEVALVREGEAWKLDSLRSNAPVGP